MAQTLLPLSSPLPHLLPHLGHSHSILASLGAPPTSSTFWDPSSLPASAGRLRGWETQIHLQWRIYIYCCRYLQLPSTNCLWREIAVGWRESPVQSHAPSQGNLHSTTNQFLTISTHIETILKNTSSSITSWVFDSSAIGPACSMTSSSVQAASFLSFPWILIPRKGFLN